MRNSITGAWIYAMVMIFMVILIGYVSVTINYANTFEMSADVLKMIEQGEGFNKPVREKIARYLEGNHHTVKNGCRMNTLNEDCATGVNGTSPTLVSTTGGGQYDYCISRKMIEKDGKKVTYYQLSLFFSFSLPLLDNLWTFNVPGETAGLAYVTDDWFDGKC